MIGKKWNEFQQARKTACALHTEFEKQEKNFQCLDNKNLVAAGDPCDNNGEPLKRCGKYELSVRCQNTTCPYHEWNTKHYRTYIKLWDARWDEFEAFLNLFVFKTKHKEKE